MTFTGVPVDCLFWEEAACLLHEKLWPEPMPYHLFSSAFLGKGPHFISERRRYLGYQILVDGLKAGHFFTWKISPGHNQPIREAQPDKFWGIENIYKSDAVENGHIGNILEKVTTAGFKIKALKLTQLTKSDAEAFYEIHKERPFFGELVAFMTRGPIVAAVLEKENAVSDFRSLIGATNPAEAAEGTLRKLYATSMGENALHGSDSDENGALEAAFHFASRECF